MPTKGAVGDMDHLEDVRHKRARAEADAGARDESAGCSAKRAAQAMSNQASLFSFHYCFKLNSMCS
jgi:hypothetical protein